LQVEDVVDLLALSSANQRLAAVLRANWAWRQRLLHHGWDVEAIVRNRVFVKRPTWMQDIPNWLIMARAASERRGARHSAPPIMATGEEAGSVAPRTCPFKGLHKILNIVSQIDSHHHFYSHSPLPVMPSTALKKILPPWALYQSKIPCLYMQESRIILSFLYYDVSNNTDLFPAHLHPDFLLGKLFICPTMRHFMTQPPHLQLGWAVQICVRLLNLMKDLRSDPTAPLDQPCPHARVPSIAFQSDSENPWPDHHWDLRWSAQSTLRLVGYYTQYELRDGLRTDSVLPQSKEPLRCTLVRDSADPTRYLGDADTNRRTFSLGGTRAGRNFLWQITNNEGETWMYGGMLLPWGLVGQWGRPEEGSPVQGEYYLWIEE